MAEPTDTDVKRYDHADFVDRFLEGLSNAMGGSAGPRSLGVTSRMRSLHKNGDISTSRKVLDARMALGADDSLYLQSGLGLLWAGDDNLDDKHLLFPSSMGTSGLQSNVRDAVRAGMVVHLDAQIKNVMLSLSARLPALLHMLTLPEVRKYVVETLKKGEMLTNAPGSLATLVEEIAASPGSPMNTSKFSAWVALINNPESGAPFLEELITFCAALEGLYTTTSSAGVTAYSPFQLADLYTSAAVDVALVRDRSTMESVMRATRACRAIDVNSREAIRDEGPPGATHPPNIRRYHRTPLGAASVVTAGVGPRLPTPINTSAPEGINAGTINVSAKRPRTGGGGWMSGLLDNVASVSAFPDDPATSAIPDIQEHRIELAEDQILPRNDTDYNQDINRLRKLVLEPIGAQAALSMAVAASPLWSPEMVLKINVTAALDDYDPAKDFSRLVGASDKRLDPTGVEVYGLWDTRNNSANDCWLRTTGKTVVRALYDPINSDVSRAIPPEVGMWLRNGALGSIASALNRPIVEGNNLDDATNQARNQALSNDTSRPDACGRGVDAASHVMRSLYSSTKDPKVAGAGYSDGDNRFVSYVLLRGLTSSVGPDQPGSTDSLPYARGAKLIGNSADSETDPQSIQNLFTRLNSHAQAQAPEALVDAWTRRDSDPKVRGFGTRLDEMVALQGLTLTTDKKAEREVMLRAGLAQDGELGSCSSQTLCNTLRGVHWAPIGKSSQTNHSVVSYAPVAVAASAAATYEHLIDSLKPAWQDSRACQTHVPESVRLAMGAALKLCQLPHMLNFDALRSSNGKSMSDLMVEGTSLTAVEPASYRTIAPTRRLDKEGVYVTVPSAFSGVWPSKIEGVVRTTASSLLEQQFSRAPDDSDLESCSGDDSDNGALAADPFASNDAPVEFDAVTDELVRLHALSSGGINLPPEQQVTAPKRRLAIPNFPVGLTHSNKSEYTNGTGDGDSINRFVQNSGPRSAGNHTEPNDRNGYAPKWLTTHARVQALVRECYQLSVQVRELNLQSSAFTSTAPTPEPLVSSQVERERRGAIWEDALREMSISSDRLYNFLRTVSGTLHEDIQSVVEVEEARSARIAP